MCLRKWLIMTPFSLFFVSPQDGRGVCGNEPSLLFSFPFFFSNGEGRGVAHCPGFFFFFLTAKEFRRFPFSLSSPSPFSPYQHVRGKDRILFFSSDGDLPGNRESMNPALPPSFSPLFFFLFFPHKAAGHRTERPLSFFQIPSALAAGDSGG